MKEHLTGIRNKLGVYIHAITLEEFMLEDPPCKECLVQSICIRKIGGHKYSSIQITVCDEFNKYLVKRNSK